MIDPIVAAVSPVVAVLSTPAGMITGAMIAGAVGLVIRNALAERAMGAAPGAIPEVEPLVMGAPRRDPLRDPMLPLASGEEI